MGSAEQDQQKVIDITKLYGQMIKVKMSRTPDRRLGRFGEIEIGHYESGTGRLNIPKSTADHIPHHTIFDLWEVNTPQEIEALLQADEFNKKKPDAPILILIPVEEREE